MPDDSHGDVVLGAGPVGQNVPQRRRLPELRVGVVGHELARECSW
nr:hypothetical protein [Mycobacterium persicum]